MKCAPLLILLLAAAPALAGHPWAWLLAARGRRESIQNDGWRWVGCWGWAVE